MRARELVLLVALLPGCLPNDVLFELELPVDARTVSVVSRDLGSGEVQALELEVGGGGRTSFVVPLTRNEQPLEHVVTVRRAGSLAGIAFLEVCTRGSMRVARPLRARPWDGDRDGSRDSTRAGCAPEAVDCDDTDAGIRPGISPDPSRCGIDTNCDGALDACPDEDRDLVPRCGALRVPCDCDDSDPNVLPGADDLCGDGLDADCDGIDPACDDDGDGFDTRTDCDDARGDVFPGAREVCDGADQDCDGVVDDAGTCRTSDLDGDGVLACASSGAACDLDDCDAAVFPGAEDRCGDGVDADGDGTDPACAPGDRDGDGWVSLSSGGSDCDDSDPLAYPLAPDFCEDGVAQNCSADRACSLDVDGDGWIERAECERSADVAPDVLERCNGIDEDCDGVVDEVRGATRSGFASGWGCTADPRTLDYATDFAHCGGCGLSCGRTTADRCHRGACRCGSGPACDATSVCCAGTCVPGGCGP